MTFIHLLTHSLIAFRTSHPKDLFFFLEYCNFACVLTPYRILLRSVLWTGLAVSLTTGFRFPSEGVRLFSPLHTYLLWILSILLFSGYWKLFPLELSCRIVTTPPPCSLQVKKVWSVAFIAWCLGKGTAGCSYAENNQPVKITEFQ